ncbi:hypothetical protein NOVOSPHI9U_360005 [Novosphingobium sp. 9U]|nr:hypothetical protein NOVOSPHI9U_360005 [Novosphingobium sp. 9U]
MEIRRISLVRAVRAMMAESEIRHVDIITRDILDGRVIGFLQRQGTLSFSNDLATQLHRDATLLLFDRDEVIGPGHHGAMVRHQVLLRFNESERTGS